MSADLPANFTLGLQPSCCPLLVSGAMMTRGNAAFRSSGETTNAGQVFLISVPMVGSRLTQYTSPRFTIPIPRCLHPQAALRAARSQLQAYSPRTNRHGEP